MKRSGLFHYKTVFGSLSVFKLSKKRSCYLMECWSKLLSDSKLEALENMRGVSWGWKVTCFMWAPVDVLDFEADAAADVKGGVFGSLGASSSSSLRWGGGGVVDTTSSFSDWAASIWPFSSHSSMLCRPLKITWKYSHKQHNEWSTISFPNIVILVVWLQLRSLGLRTTPRS